MASYVNLVVDQGTDFNDIITITDDQTNTAINIVGYSVSSQLRRSYYSANISGNLTCTISDGPNGVIGIALSSANSFNISPQTYVFDVVTIDTSGIHNRVMEGTFTLTPGVTR